MAFYEPGKHEVVITEYAQGESPGKQTPFLRITFEVTGRLDKSGAVETVGKTFARDATLWLTGPAQWALDQSFEALGSKVSLNPDELVGTTQRAFCTHEKRGGKTYERWSFIPPKDGRKSPKRSTKAKLAASKRPALSRSRRTKIYRFDELIEQLGA